jgi:biotin transporter BioY
MRQAKTAEPRPQLEAVLQCLFVVLVGRVLHDNGVVSFADFTLLLGLGLPLLWDRDFLRGRRQLRDNLL